MIYGLGDRNETEELRKRYDAMVNVLSDILDCGRWEIEELFDSENRVEPGEIIKNYVKEIGTIPGWNAIYYEAMYIFADENDLEMGKDVKIYINGAIDTHIYAREDLDVEIVEKMENLFNLPAEIMKN